MIRKMPVRAQILHCLFLLFSVCLLLLLTPLSALANTVTINDQAGVLDAGKVRVEAAKLPDRVLIVTTKTFDGDQNALNQSTRASLPDQSSIAIDIDTAQRHLSVESGTNVKISDSQASDAVTAFKDNFNGGDYTSATIAVLDSLLNALTGHSSSITPLGVIVVIVIVLGVAVLVLVAIVLGRRPPENGGRRGGRWSGIYPYIPGYYAGTRHTTGTPSAGSFGGGAGGGFGGGSSGGGAGGSF